MPTMMPTAMSTATISRGFAALALLAGLAAPAGAEAPARAEASKEWQGRYRYTHSAGRTVGGTGIVVDYDLRLAAPDRRDGCVLTVQGFQSDETILCRTRPEGQSLTVAFDRFGDGRVVNKYGVAIYTPGQALFTLSKEGAKLVTRWQAIRPDGEGVAESGAFFERENDTGRR